MQARFMEEQPQQSLQPEAVELLLHLNLPCAEHGFSFSRRGGLRFGQRFAQVEVEPHAQRAIVILLDGFRDVGPDRCAVERAFAVVVQRRVGHDGEVRRRLTQSHHDFKVPVLAAGAAEPAATLFPFCLTDCDEQRPVFFAGRGPIRRVELERPIGIMLLDRGWLTRPLGRQAKMSNRGFHGRSPSA